MTQVVVDLGAAVADPDLFDATELPGAQVRFRLGGTFQALIAGVQGSGWGVDDLSVSNVKEASACAGVPPVTINSAVSRKSHAGIGPADIVIDLSGQVQNGNVTSESRQCRITELRLGFAAPPGGPGDTPVTILEQGVPGAAQEDYATYTGSSTVSAAVESNELVLTFAPGLENARTYKITLGPEISAIAGQSIEVRALFADASSDGRVNATDRSVVVGVWTGSGFSAATDVNRDGATNSTDRSFVVGVWTGSSYCP